MSVSRRNFLKGGTLVILSAGIPLKLSMLANAQRRNASASVTSSGFQIPYASQRDPLYYLKSSSFSPYLNDTFRFRAQSGKAVSVKLFKVTDFKKSTDVVSEDSFSLVFRGPSNQPLKQNIYTIEHAALGNYTLLATPIVSRDKRAMYYEVIINHRTR
jgi:hypothetical protein